MIQKKIHTDKEIHLYLELLQIAHNSKSQGVEIHAAVAHQSREGAKYNMSFQKSRTRRIGKPKTISKL